MVTLLMELVAPSPILLPPNTGETSTSTKMSHGLSALREEQISFRFDLDHNLIGIPTKLLSVLQTLVHQIGHSLGLSHSNVYDSVMFPFVKTFNASSPMTFHREDVKAIQTLYGEKTGTNDLTLAQVAAGEKKTAVFLYKSFPLQQPKEREIYVLTLPLTQSSELLMGILMSSRVTR